MDKLLVVIPALKKRVAFPDDLVKKLAGITLIRRAIAIAAEVVPKSQILVATDSEEIALICQRQSVTVSLDAALYFSEHAAVAIHILPVLQTRPEQWKDLLVLSPYVPLLRGEVLRKAYEHYSNTKAEFLVPVSSISNNVFVAKKETLQERSFMTVQSLTVESGAFSIINRTLLEAKNNLEFEISPFSIGEGLIEIRDYHDWWLCEKLLNRRRIVFRIIGNKEVGMGHIYRCLALAHEISDHEVYFVCDTGSGVAANMLAGSSYWLEVYEPEAIDQAILDLKPDMLVNDILNTNKKYVHDFKKAGIHVVNFEDLGSGASESDITINDLYDDPLLPGERILWGQEWFILRDEFNDACPQQLENEVKRILISFGGTDPSDFTRRVLTLVSSYCAARNIAIDVVTGGGYRHIDSLEALIGNLAGEVTYTHATGVISQIMETVQLAICSNGRTVYELAHMNVPAIVLSHHEREKSHWFACEENGFITVDAVDDSEIGEEVLKKLQRLVEDIIYRGKLFSNTAHHNFAGNKHKVVGLIQQLLKKGK